MTEYGSYLTTGWKVLSHFPSTAFISSTSSLFESRFAEAGSHLLHERLNSCKLMAVGDRSDEMKLCFFQTENPYTRRSLSPGQGFLPRVRVFALED